MMKNLILLSCFIIYNLQSNAQEVNYYFEQFTQEYIDLEQAISLNNGEVWDDPDYIVPIGFNFQLFNDTITELYFDEDFGGFLYQPDGSHIIVVSSADLADISYGTEDESSSPISYQLTGEEGSKIFKLEWKNAGYLDNDERQYYANIQLWLYQDSNMIEIHYGPNYVDDVFYNWESDVCAIANFDPDTDEGYFVEDIDGEFVFNYHIIDDIFEPNYFSSIPEEGTVFRFFPEYIIGIEEQTSTTSIHPNPCANQLSINLTESNKFTYIITNMQGQRLLEGSSTQRNTKINVHTLPTGMYLLETSNISGNNKQTFIKK